MGLDVKSSWLEGRLYLITCISSVMCYFCPSCFACELRCERGRARASGFSSKEFRLSARSGMDASMFDFELPYGIWSIWPWPPLEKGLLVDKSKFSINFS